MISGIIARARSLWEAIRRRPDVEAEMNDEFRTHMEMRADDLKRTGLTSSAARRQARLEFGSTERYKDEARASRGLKRVDQLGVSWLDFKLGFRMLARYPGLTLVGGLSMAFAIWVGAGAFELIKQVLSPTLPFSEGDRIVGLQNWDIKENSEHRQSLHDFVTWREQLKTVEDLGAFQMRQRNLVTASGEAEPVEVAEISASAFRVTRVAPLLGRTLVAGDEDPAAPLVIVIGHDIWQRRFAGDPRIVGQTVSLGTTPATIVGVMPPKYGFPFAQSLWVPLRLNPLEYERGAGPGINMFGRLAPGASMKSAQAELETLGRRASADFPRTHEHLRPEVKSYAQSLMNIPGIAAMLIGSSNLLLVLLVVLICGNVALLMFARAATRENEITVRTALGASRSRIIMQLFSEALVLSGLAAAIGLSAASVGIRWTMHVVQAEILDGAPLPFWISDRLSPSTIIYVLMLTLIGSLICGVLPALKVTSGLQDRLRAAGAGGGGLRFGGIWTLVIVSQIAVTVVFPVMGVALRAEQNTVATFDVGIPDRSYLSARIDMDRERSQATGDTSRAAYLARFASSYEELHRRLATVSGVRSVTVAERLPRMYHPFRFVEIDDGMKAPLDPRWSAYRVSSAAVAPDYFEVMDAPIRTGRAFTQSDMSPDARTIIVNESFVKTVFGGANPIGRRVRYIYTEEDPGEFANAKPGPWYQVIGVTKDLGMGYEAGKNRGIYHPLSDTVTSIHVAIRTYGPPEEFGPRLRAIALAVNPALRVSRIMPIYRLSEAELQFYDFWLLLTGLVSGLAILLSLSGIYAVMSFTVSRRTREIGIRIALGASSRKLVAVIFRRPMIQVGLGVLVGTIAIAVMLFGASEGNMELKWLFWLFGYSLVMLGVCLLACIVPTRRALAVQPSEALRSDG